MTDLMVRRAWKKMEASQVEPLFQAAWAFKEAHMPQAIYAVTQNYHECLKRPTLAESFGAYCRESFEVDTLILNAMRSSRKWVAFISHSTEHSLSSAPDFITLPDQQVTGQFFDPLAFDHPWVDNTMRRHKLPLQPGDWVIALMAEDPDDTHVFFAQEGQRLILFDGQASRFEFYGFSPPIPDHFTWIRRV